MPIRISSLCIQIDRTFDNWPDALTVANALVLLGGDSKIAVYGCDAIEVLREYEEGHGGTQYAIDGKDRLGRRFTLTREAPAFFFAYEHACGYYSPIEYTRATKQLRKETPFYDALVYRIGIGAETMTAIFYGTPTWWVLGDFEVGADEVEDK